ncbi:MAG: chromate efflux transporter [Verrucomicrobiae bacterium]|nr:chromate efflux transporter [Verrucomicrobiae bacterium]
MSELSATASRPTFREALRFWLKLGWISFGGPAGQIAIMHTELVDRKRWISNDRFLHALNFCMLLPGPEAQQLATYCGWLLHRTRGGIVAGVLFVLPSVFVLWALSYIYLAFGNLGPVEAAFVGLKPVVLAIVIGAVVRIGKKALHGMAKWGLAALAFVAIFFLKLPFPLIIISAGLLGWFGARREWRGFAIPKTRSDASEDPGRTRRSDGKRIAIVLLAGLLLWWAPVGVASRVLGPDHTVTREGVFFSKAAMVTFGGAYAVLPYVAQKAVEEHQWLAAEQMLDGLGLAETTPGPLIMVVQFVGFVGAWQHPGGLDSLVAGTLGALMTTWVTFVPCFLWIFLGAPFIERLHGHAGLTGALSAITAAVVGVILNLAIWFGFHVLFPASQPDWFGILLCALALFVALRWKIEVLWLVAAGCLAGLMRWWAGGIA